MSLPIKFFCALFVIGFAGLFILKKPDGTPWLSANDFAPDTSALMSEASALMKQAKNASSTITLNSDDVDNKAEKNSSGIYRWKDQDGQWQYSDTPPQNQTAETITVSGHLNRDLVDTTSLQAARETKPEEQTTNTSGIIPASMSPEKISKLIEDTQNVQKLMDDRQSQIDQY